MKLSYIIPIYNGKDYIIRCLDSICLQDIPVSDYEVLVIDDCSTDNTCELVSAYAENHSNVRLLCQQENMRQGAARNWGLREAKGEYISFVDGDDIVLDGVVPALRWAEKLHVDMVYCSCYHEKTPTTAVLKEIDMLEGQILSGRDFCEQYQHEGVFWYPWGFLIHREWLVKLNYPFIEKRQHEDRDWLAYVLSHAGSVCNSLVPMYRYVCNPVSTCRALRYSTVFDHVASGIRHIQLSKDLRADCPNLSKTLYVFGVDEIYKNLRLRNLSKFTWEDNRHLYDEQHLAPLLSDLKKVCRTESLPFAVHFVAYYHAIELLILCLANPLARTGRKIVSLLR